MKRFVLSFVAVSLCAMPHPSILAADPPPPSIDQVVVSGAQKNLRITPYPGAQAYQFFSASNAGGPYVLNPNFVLSPYVTGYGIIQTTNGPVTITNYAYEYRLLNFPNPSGFFTLSATPLPGNTIALATVMNRLAYGPTPDDLITYSNNPQAYIDEQLNMNGLPEAPDAYTVETTNAIVSNPLTNWTLITMTGSIASANFYLFTTQPGDVYLDDIQLNPYIYTNLVVTNLVNGTNQIVTNGIFSHIEYTNLLSNGDFETGSLSPWTAAGGASGSTVVGGAGRSGSSGLHVVSTTGGTSPGVNYVRQIINNAGFASTNRCILSYWYLPSANSSKLRLQLGSGLNSTPGGIPATPTWVYATATGKANATGRLYFYLSGAGACYLDDIKLVAGSVAESGPNLIVNGDFETGTSGSWSFATRYTNSTINATTAHGGIYSLQLVGTSSGSAATGSSMYQSRTLINGATYTLSFWYLATTPGVTLTAQLDGAGLQALPDTDLGGTYRRLLSGTATLNDYRAWFCQHAVGSRRQLFEVLSQFWENHFVTQQSKSRDYIDNFGYSSTVAGILATDWEWREMTNWRNAMLDPNCTFYDLLKISAESPAMIVYLDSVASKGSGKNVANENFARELLELFTFGVDNGYDQDDIVTASRAWTGWSVELVDTVNATNPFAPASVTLYPGSNSTVKAATIGTWAFNFKSSNYGTNRAPLFPGKTVPARFGPPWAGASYQLTLPPRTGTNGIQDGYSVIAHLANLPFTQEFISIKLCRLFVHDEFPNPTTYADRPEYYFYDYTDPNRSAEAELVHQCMLAWENSTPKGNLRAVLNVIFNSELFRSHAAQAQKVKTPLEFVASTIRALRGSTNGGSGFTATTDGYAFGTPLTRMGGMNLFDRDAPDGYPETGPNWISAGTLVERIRFVQSFCILAGQTGHTGSQSGTGNDAGNNFCDPVGLLKDRLANFTDAAAVTDYFLGLLYPAEGAANLQLYRAAGINFLNTADNGTASAFNTISGTTYDTRVRGLVALLMALPRFQEQ
jgi:uncharacterized protein (DUF1800 family)